MTLLRLCVLVLALCAFVVPAFAEDADTDHAPTHEPTESTAEAAGGAASNPLSIDPDLAICTAIVFVLLLLVLAKFAWRPIMAGLEKRENSIAAQIAEAQAANEKAAATLEQYQQKLAAASDEVRGLIAEGKREAEAMRDKIVAEAQEVARRERERALTEIGAAKNAALGEIAATHVDHAFALARQVVRKEINREEHGALIRESLERFPSNNN